RGTGAYVHQGRRFAARAGALGAARDRRRSRVPGVDRLRKDASSPLARRTDRQVGARSKKRDAVITHPEKVLFPADGITKGELARYYETVAPMMLPHLRGRPVTMERFPAGIDKEGFIQKDLSKGFPDWLERVEVPKKNGTTRYPLVGDERSL